MFNSVLYYDLHSPVILRRNNKGAKIFKKQSEAADNHNLFAYIIGRSEFSFCYWKFSSLIFRHRLFITAGSKRSSLMNPNTRQEISYLPLREYYPRAD